MDIMSWNDYVTSKRIVIISRLLGIAIALVGALFVGDLLGEAQTMGIHELPIESGTLDGVRREYIEEGSLFGRWTEEVTIAEIDGIEYKVSGAVADFSNLSSGEKVEFRVRDGLIVEIGEDLDEAR